MARDPVRCTPAQLQKIRDDVRAEVNANSVAIIEACNAAGKPKLAAGFLKQRVPLATVRKKLGLEPSIVSATATIQKQEISAGWEKAFARRRDELQCRRAVR